MSHYYHYGFFYKPQIENVVRPDMKKYAQDLSLQFKVFIAGVGISFLLFIMFMVGMVSSVSNMASPGSAFSLMFLPFVGFGFCGFMASFTYSRMRTANALVAIINQIEEKDKIEIKNISYEYSASESDTLYAVKLLMKRDNLKNYEIIDDVLVARRSLGIKSAQEGGTVTAGETPRGFCPYCGKQLQGDETFCKSCGNKLK